MLANGDAIEIGNTVVPLRAAERPALAARAEQPRSTFDDEDEELSTVAGKPMRARRRRARGRCRRRAPRPRGPRRCRRRTPLRPRAARRQPPPLRRMLPMASPMPIADADGASPADRVPPHAAPTMLGEPMPASAADPEPDADDCPVNGRDGRSMPRQPPRADAGYPQATEMPPHSGPRADAADPDAAVAAAMPRPRTSRRRRTAWRRDARSRAPQPHRAAQQAHEDDPRRRGPRAVRGDHDDRDRQAARRRSARRRPRRRRRSAIQPASRRASRRSKVSRDRRRPSRDDAEDEAAETAEAEPKTVEPRRSTTSRPPRPSRRSRRRSTPAEDRSRAEGGATSRRPRRSPTKPSPRSSRRRPSPSVEARKKASPRSRQSRRRSRRPTPRRAATPTRRRREARRARRSGESAHEGRRALSREEVQRGARASLARAAKSADDDEARELRRTVGHLREVGRGVQLGHGAGGAGRPTRSDAAQGAELRSHAGGAFDDEIQTASSRQVAPKAADRFMADKNYEQARSAVLDAPRSSARRERAHEAWSRRSSSRRPRELYSEASKEGRRSGRRRRRSASDPATSSTPKSHVVPEGREARESLLVTSRPAITLLELLELERLVDVRIGAVDRRRDLVRLLADRRRPSRS